VLEAPFTCACQARSLRCVFALFCRHTQLREKRPVTRIGHIDMGPAKVKEPAVSPAVVASPDCSARQ